MVGAAYFWIRSEFCPSLSLSLSLSFYFSHTPSISLSLPFFLSLPLSTLYLSLSLFRLVEIEIYRMHTATTTAAVNKLSFSCSCAEKTSNILFMADTPHTSTKYMRRRMCARVCMCRAKCQNINISTSHVHVHRVHCFHLFIRSDWLPANAFLVYSDLLLLFSFFHSSTLRLSQSLPPDQSNKNCHSKYQ